MTIKTFLDILVYSGTILGYLPLFPYLGQIPRILFPVAFLFGLLADRRGYVLKGHLPTVCSVLLFAFYGMQFSWQDIASPAANLLIVLLSVRLASERSTRHYLQLLALSLFALASSSLFSLSAIFLLYLILLIFIIAVALVVLCFYAFDPGASFTRDGARKVVTFALLLPTASLPLMLLFFFILPRTQQPLWNFLNAAQVQTTGLSDRVRPGSSASSGAIKTVAFRAESPRLDGSRLYWRGIVFNQFASGAWIRREPPRREVNRPLPRGNVVQTVYPEPSKTPYLIALDVPRQISGVREYASADQVHVRTALAPRRGKYTSVSVIADTITTPGGIDRDFYLSTPPDLSPRLLALGRQVSSWGEDRRKIARLEEFFLNGKFLYATTGLPVSADPLDEFLFVKKQGNCEFYASSVALLLRLAGIPTRLVGGYYGGDFNELGEYYVVTEDRAHVWVEAHVRGEGWVRVDPSAWAVNGPLQKEQTARNNLMHRFKLSLDALGYYWNQVVINYDLEQQFQLFNRASHELRRFTFGAVSPGVRRMVLILLVCCTVVAAALFARRRHRSPEERVLRTFLDRIRKMYGITLSPSAGLQDLRSVKSPAVERFIDIYSRGIYMDRKLSSAELLQLKRLIRDMKG